MKFVSKLRQRGVTLFELLLVLFVAAFVAVAVATIYNKVNTTYKTNVLFNDVQQLAANTRSLYGSSGNYSGLDSSTAISAGIAPDGMKNTSNEAVHVFSSAAGSWTIAPTAANAEFIITVKNLSKTVCTDLASKGLGVALSVAATGGAVTDVTTAVSKCSAATDTNTVALTYN